MDKLSGMNLCFLWPSLLWVVLVPILLFIVIKIIWPHALGGIKGKLTAWLLVAFIAILAISAWIGNDKGFTPYVLSLSALLLLAGAVIQMLIRVSKQNADYKTASPLIASEETRDSLEAIGWAAVICGSAAAFIGALFM